VNVAICRDSIGDFVVNDNEEKGSFGSGFVGAFTWSNVGKQIANGMISGSAGLVLTSLLEHLFSKGENMQDMLQRFADQIVERLTTELRNTINEAFFQDNLARVKSSAASLGEKFSAFEATQDVPLLDEAVNHSFDTVEDAIAIGPPAIGVFVVVVGLKLCLLEEKAKTNPSFHEVTLNEVDRASAVLDDFIGELLAANDRAVSEFRSCKVIPGEGEFCFITVDGVVENHQVFDKQRDRQRIVNSLNRVTVQEIIAPAMAIAATWKGSSTPPLPPVPIGSIWLEPVLDIMMS
jgi:hypothetical protein